MTKYSGEILMGDVWKAVEKVASEYDLLNSNFENLSRSYLDFFIEGDCINLGFNDLRTQYLIRFEIQEDVIDSIPLEEKIFHSYICKNDLNLIPNDKKNLESTLKEIIEDLKSIEIDKLKYISELEDLTNKDFEGKTYQERLLKHYIKKLEDAEAQILSYIKGNLSKETNKNKYREIFHSPFLINSQYDYKFAKHTYKIESVSDLKNKLGNIRLRRYFELERLYRTDKDKFLTELKEDLNAFNIIEEIKDIIDKSKLLSQRKDLLYDILELFHVDKFQLFCNVVPQQVEGILYDYCIEFGINEDSLKNSTLGDKINLLIENENDEIDYEYFAFRFPIIRNRVAHGKLVDQNLDLNSWLLLLDLKYICDLMLSSTLEINSNINFISTLNEHSDLLELLKLAPIIERGIDDFYTDVKERLFDLKDVLRKKLIYDRFPFELIEEDHKNETRQHLLKIKKIGINDQECKRILDQINSA
jgi:hypothetical protein